MERLSPPKPRRNEDALCETAGSAPHGAGLRPPGRGVPDPCRRPERLHRTRHTRNSSRGMTPSGERGTLTVSQFVQQSLCVSPRENSSVSSVLRIQQGSTSDMLWPVAELIAHMSD